MKINTVNPISFQIIFSSEATKLFYIILLTQQIIIIIPSKQFQTHSSQRLCF